LRKEIQNAFSFAPQTVAAQAAGFYCNKGETMKENAYLAACKKREEALKTVDRLNAETNDLIRRRDDARQLFETLTDEGSRARDALRDATTKFSTINFECQKLFAETKSI
jgi:hypothetical protein